MKKIYILLFIALSFLSACNYDELVDAFEQLEEKSYYGNWCGPGKSGPEDPVDSLDVLCMNHDNCYDAITEPFNYWDCIPGKKADCDTTLVADLIDLDPDSSNWKLPPENNAAAEKYRADALKVFGPCTDIASEFYSRNINYNLEQGL